MSSHLLVVFTCITQVLRFGTAFILFSPFSTLEIKGGMFYVQKFRPAEDIYSQGHQLVY